MRCLILSAVLFLSGCAASSYFLTGGDRSAGSVTLLCNYDLTTQCVPDYAEMTRTAAEACIKWGYTDAQAFGGVKKVPTHEYAGYIEMQYQCIGHLEQP